MGMGLFVAAGGGGDAIAASMLALAADTDGPCVATYAWDRLIVDPLPGPRSTSDFSGLVVHDRGVYEIVGSTGTRSPARSAIPSLAAALPVRFFLLDPRDGAPGMAEQLRAVASHAGAESIVLVDVGGDVVARGDEPELRSPLADTLALVACRLSGLPFVARVCGPGLDGELSEEQVLRRCDELSARRLTDLSADRAERFASIFEWHPSEATGMFVAAARGRRGTVEVRDAGTHIQLTDYGPAIFEIEGPRLAEANLLARPMSTASTLTAVEQVVRHLRGRSELDYERTKAATRRTHSVEREPARLAIAVDEQTEQARTRGADYLTIRRLAELVATTGDELTKLTTALRAHDASRCDPPLWRVR